MFNLKLLLLLAFLSFSHQDSHCVVTYEYCVKEIDYPDNYEPTRSSIPHCYDEENKLCLGCEDGYALSFDKKSCISFPNCEYLQQGDNKCEECEYYFHLNSEGKCERTTCLLYEDNDKDCKECFYGYYLKDKKCIKIPKPYCISMSSTDENKCTGCLGNFPLVNGECLAPKNFIQGCYNYNIQEKCTICHQDYELKDGTCVFKGCSGNEKKYEECFFCEAGFHEDADGICIGYDGTKDATDNAKSNKIEYALLMVILALIF